MSIDSLPTLASQPVNDTVSPVIETPERRSRSAAAAVKVGWERLAATMALVLIFPFLLALMLWIRLDSRGPAFYRQTRVGRDGIPFTLVKLRTMHVGADRHQPEPTNPDDALAEKDRRDPRITRAGRLLRRLSLDELPQLINVVTGTMSLIGPRPALPSEVARYQEVALRRLDVRPGLTGLWQVSGRADLSWSEALELDLAYVDTWSLRQDMSILVRTIPAVVGGRGAY